MASPRAGKEKGLAVKTTLRASGLAPACHLARAALRRIVRGGGQALTRGSPPCSNAGRPARQALPPIVRVAGRAPTRRSPAGSNAWPHHQSSDREPHT